MEDVKFAQLNQEEINELNQLESKLGVTLIAYDPRTTNGFTSESKEDSSMDSSPL